MGHGLGLMGSATRDLGLKSDLVRIGDLKLSAGVELLYGVALGGSKLVANLLLISETGCIAVWELISGLELTGSVFMGGLQHMTAAMERVADL